MRQLTHEESSAAAAISQAELRPALSVVVPVHNEQDNLSELIDRIVETLTPLEGEFEIIVVDDGSVDDSFAVMTEASRRYPEVQVVRLARRYGQTAALAAGIDEARGETIITIDGDLQNDPADIPRLLDHLEEGGYDVVSGWRVKRADPLFSRVVPSYLANRLIARISSVKLHDFGCTLRAYRHHALEDLVLYGEMHRFIPALLGWSGYQVSELEVRHYPRKAGSSKYSLWRFFRVILDLINIKFLISYSTRPIQIFGGAGLVCLGLSGVCLASAVGLKLAQGFDLTGNPLLYLSILLCLVSFQFITMGLISEVNVRAFHELKRARVYRVRERVRRGEVVARTRKRLWGAR